MILAVDPGLRGSGVAVFDAPIPRLIAADYRPGLAQGRGVPAWCRAADAVEAWARPYPVREIVIERPVVYALGKSKGDPDDILELLGVVATIAERLGRGRRVILYRPKEWKGSVPKGIHNARVLGRLSPEEVDAMSPTVPPSLRHNMIDAVGLGLAHAKKTGRRP